MTATLTAVMLTACGASTETRPDHAGLGPAVAHTPVTSAPSMPAATSSTSTSRPSPTPTCAESTGRQALHDALPRVSRTGTDDLWEWDPANADTSTYDRCTPLSWVVLGIKGPTGSSPYHVLLFHRGRFVGTATDRAQGYAPEVTRRSAGAISVTYTYNLPGEPTAAASGRATSTFTWDDDRMRVIRTGQLPPEGDEGDDPDDAARTTRTAPTAPTGLPRGATPVTAIRPAREGGGPETAVILSPSRNIGCDLSASSAGCGVLSYLQDRTFGADEVGPAWWFDLDGSGPPAVVSKGDAPLFAAEDVPAQVVRYGQTVYHRTYACTSAASGMTCWNTATGHGVTMSRKGYRAF